MQFDAVFIDADNTLFDFDRTQNKALLQTLNYFKLPADSESLALYERVNFSCWGLYGEGKISNNEINPLRWAQWLEQSGSNQHIGVTELSDHYAESLSEQCEKEEGADELINYLSSKFPVHVITNGLPFAQKHRWRKAGWENKIHGITVSGEVGVQKPHADIFHIAMKAVGVTDPSRCLMIGDSLEADVKGPQGVGMKGCWYRRNDAENGTNIEPDFVATHLDQIPPMLF